MRRIPHIFVYVPFVAIVDMLLINSSFLLVFALRWGFALHTTNVSAYIGALPAICSISLVILYANDLYSGWLTRRKYELVYSSLVSAFVICVSTMAISFWLREFAFPRTVIVGSAILQSVLLTAFRLLAQHLYWSTQGRRRVIVIGPTERSAVSLVEKLEPRVPNWMVFVGCCAADDVRSLEEKTVDCDAVMLTPRLAGQRDLIKVCTRLRKDVLIVPAAMEMSMIGAVPTSVDDVLILTLQSPHLTTAQAVMKRISDIVISSVMLFLLSPVIVATATVVKLTSKGSVIFKQDRVGKNGVEYTLYKFRTMIEDAERHTGPVLAQESDPRITSTGRVLRSTRLDELPQLFNVLIGNMSMVGPRPERQVFVSQFRKSIAGYDLRYSVKPGITGLAQVSGGYSTSAERKLRYDLFYIYNYSLVQDLRILIRTVLVVFHRDQARGVKRDGRITSFKDSRTQEGQHADISESPVSCEMRAVMVSDEGIRN